MILSFYLKQKKKKKSKSRGKEIMEINEMENGWKIEKINEIKGGSLKRWLNYYAITSSNKREGKENSYDQYQE